jgi:uncharacterized protein (DUF2236 family)
VDFGRSPRSPAALNKDLFARESSMSVAIGTMTLPGALGRPIAAAGRRMLSIPSTVDFSRPPGEPALVDAASLSWRIFNNPVALFIGGVTAVILELAEPRVRAGVWDHSSFRTDPLRRLQRTGMAAMVTVYGARSEAERMIAGVVRMHGGVTGQASTGQPYSANDVELLDWVQATASFGFIGAYDAYVRGLSPAERDQAYAEAAPAARLYGALGAPGSAREMEGLTERLAPALEPSPVLTEFLAIMRTANIAPGLLKPLQDILVRAAVDLVPSHLRQKLELETQGLRAWERPLVCAAARTVDRLRLDSSPAVQACLRLGLPADYLYRRG